MSIPPDSIRLNATSVDSRRLIDLRSDLLHPFKGAGGCRQVGAITGEY